MNFMAFAKGALLASLLVSGFAGWGISVAQTYPSRPIAIVVPFPAGGNMDAFVRVVAEKLSPRLGQSVVVENRAGASGGTDTASVARAAPDGYTLLNAAQTQYAALPNLRPDVGYDPLKSFAPISLVAYNPPIWLVARASIPVSNLKELVAYAKANPGKLNFGSDGLGTSTHVNFEHLKKAAGIDIVHIPYQGTAPMMTALLGGQIEMAYVLLPGPLEQIRSGKLKAIASAAPTRVDPDKNLMTVAEQGYPGFDYRGWYGIVAPAGTPKNVVDRLNRELVTVMNDADLIQRIKPFGFEVAGTPPNVLADAIREEFTAWKKIVADLNLKQSN